MRVEGDPYELIGSDGDGIHDPAPLFLDADLEKLLDEVVPERVGGELDDVVDHALENDVHVLSRPFIEHPLQVSTAALVLGHKVHEASLRCHASEALEDRSPRQIPELALLVLRPGQASRGPLVLRRGTHVEDETLFAFEALVLDEGLMMIVVQSSPRPMVILG